MVVKKKKKKTAVVLEGRNRPRLKSGMNIDRPHRQIISIQLIDQVL